MYGRYGIPLWPFPASTKMVVGREIQVGEKNPNPSDEEVMKVFNLYLDEISRVWATHARKYLPKSVADNGLVIHHIGVGVVRTVQAK